MDGIDPIRQDAEHTTVAGSLESFKSVADGFAALLQLTGKNVSGIGTVNAAEMELMRLDDRRDLVRDSHTLNDADAHRDDADNIDDVEEPEADRETEHTDDDDDDQDNENKTAESDAEDSETGADDETENQDAAGGTAGNGNQPNVTGDGVGVDLGLLEGAAGAGQQVKAVVENAGAQNTTEQTVQVTVTVENDAAKTGAQSQQSTQADGPQNAAVQTDQAGRSFTPAEAQAAQATATAAQDQTAGTQQTAAQTNQTLAQQGPEVRQDRGPAQTTDARSAGAQNQSQDLSQRLGGDTRARVQVTVDGQRANQGPTEPGQFNRFVGYNPSEMRTVSTANGQAGTGTASNATTTPDTLAERPATQTTAPIPSSAAQPHTQAPQPGPLSNAPATRGDAGSALSRGGAGLSQSNTGQSSSTATSAPQPTAQAGVTQSGQSFAQTVQQTTGSERPPAPSSTQVIEQIKVNINRSVKAGMDRVTIQLRPENLGRIEVKMELSQDSKVRAFITADVRETLDLLQRDARGLERALQDAGLRTDSNNLHFALRSDSESQSGENQKGQSADAANDNANGDADDGFGEEDDYDRELAANARGGVDRLV